MNATTADERVADQYKCTRHELVWLGQVDLEMKTPLVIRKSKRENETNLHIIVEVVRVRIVLEQLVADLLKGLAENTDSISELDRHKELKEIRIQHLKLTRRSIRVRNDIYRRRSELM